MTNKLTTKGKKGGLEIPDKINTMPYKGVEQLIVGILKGKIITSGNRDELPSSLLANIFHKLDPEVRLIFKDVILEILSDLANNPNSSWRDNSGDEMLLLVSDIFSDVTSARNPIDLLLYIADKRWDLINCEENLHRRAVQALIDLQYKASEQFWKDIYRQGGSEYSNVVLTGLSLSGLSSAFDWLEEREYAPSILSALISLLPLLREEYGIDKLSEYTARIRPHIPDTSVDLFNQQAHVLNIQIYSKALSLLEFQKLYDLANQLEITIQVGELRNDIVLHIEETLRKNASSYELYKVKNPEVELISNFSDYIEKYPSKISEELRDYLFNYGMALMDKYDFGDQKSTFLHQVYVIMEKDKELEKMFFRLVYK